MREYVSRLKKSKLMILYISLILASNFLFAFFKVQKYNYAELNGLSGQITLEQYEYLSNLSSYGNYITSFISGLGCIYLILIFINKDKSISKDFLFTNILIAIVLNIINYIIAFISKIHIIDFIDSIIFICGISILSFIEYIFKNRKNLILKNKNI